MYADHLIEDAQQAAGFITPPLYRTHTAVLGIKYPSFDYQGLVPVNNEGDMWDIGTLVYSGDMAGAASYVGGKSFDIPNASVNLSLGSSQFYLAGIGYELGLQEVNRALKMGQDIGARKADAANKVAQKFIYDTVIRGSAEKGFKGLINNTSVPTANSTNGSWASATVPNILADINQVLEDVITNSGETAMPNRLLLPTSRFMLLGRTQLTNSNDSLLTYFKQNNSYTVETGSPLDIRGSRELETAGASSTKRMIAYESRPENMEFFLPGPFEFRAPFATSTLSWRVDGIMNVGQLEIYQPKAVSYRDGI